MNEHIRNELNQIPIPEGLHTRCEAGFREAANEQKGKMIMFTSKKKAIAAAIALVLMMGVIGTGAAYADTIRGFFVDVKNPIGAVVGTEYNHATDEIAVTATADADAITVTAQLLYPTEAPYAFISEVSLQNVTVTDSSGAKLLTIDETQLAAIDNAAVCIHIPLGTISLSSDEEYTISFDTVVGHAKAEQPLPMSGSWSCNFSHS